MAAAAKAPPVARNGEATARVVVFCDHYGPSSTGGAERVAQAVNERLAPELDGLTVFTAQHAPAYADRGVAVERRNPVDLSRVLGAQLSVSFGYQRAASSFVARRRPAVICAHSLHFHSSVVATRVARRFAIPLVSVAHVGDLDHVRGVAGKLAALQEQSIGRWILRSSARVIAVSDAVRAHCLELGADERRVVVVPNGVDHHRFVVTDEPEPDPVQVLFVGRLIANKGVSVLVDAARLLRARDVRVRITFVGDGPMEQTLRRDTEHLPIDLVGRRDDVPSWIQKAHIVVRPSFSEGMPLAILEAMASRRCVVASDIPANRGLVEHGSNGLLHRVGDARSLAVAIERLAVDCVYRRALATEGHRTSLGFGWDRTAASYLEVIRAAGSREGRP
jgi:glycosyltransferase involved in cell wall biosynthesis